ncbi:acetoacetate decarboxylase family protein [Algoriphagus jejuensis]|uniref:acetoacetate decarboxylase family protein n=1 Tax=Algoriphagus jejuensis TaxID=419934 RepID=UPI0031E21D65
MNKKFVLKSPAPWKVKGEAIFLIFKFKKTWVAESGLLPKHLKGKFKGGLGYVFLGNYTDTPVGKYHELLFVPGKFRKTKRQAITKNFVDSEASTQNGRENWGFPRETLPMKWLTNKNFDSLCVEKNGAPIFSAEFESKGFSFPISTSFFSIRLCQTWNKFKYYTRPAGSGWGKFLNIKRLDVNPDFFPDIRHIKPILAIKVSRFQMRYPEAKYHDDFI